MAQRPVHVSKFTGKSRVVNVNRVFAWLQRGWALFVAEPAQWLLMTLVLIVIIQVLSRIPILGPVLAMLVTPIFIAGMLYVAQRVDDEQDPAFGSMFAGFNRNPAGLMIIGALHLVASMLINSVIFMVAGGTILGGVLHGAMRGATRGDMVGLGMVIGSLLIAFVLWAILSAPVMMAMWFAPALVFFEDASPIDAIKASFSACWKNTAPFIIIYGLLMFIALIVTVALFTLGLRVSLSVMLGLFILLPVMFGAMLASYQDIFSRKP